MKPLLPRDLSELPRPNPTHGKHYELSDGVLLVIRSAKPAQEFVKSNLANILYRWEAENTGIQVFVESQFVLKEDTARVPDLAVVRDEQLVNSRDSEMFDFAPDIAVEILSPYETPIDAEKKVDEYLAAGSAEVWQVFAELRKLHIRTLTGSRELKGDDLLTTPILPGFQIPVGAIFV